MKRLLVLAALTSALPAATAGGLLDGMRFVGETGPVGRAADEHGAWLTFAGGRLLKSSPASCGSDSFEPGDYTATEEAGTIRFRATTTSEDYGRIDWQGVVGDGGIEGTLVWYPKPSIFVPAPRPYAKWFKAQSTH